MIIKLLLAAIVGLAGGLAVGTGFVAFLAVLGIIPRLIQLTKTAEMIRFYEAAVVFGAVIISFLSLSNPVFHFSKYIIIPIGLASGIFIGMLAAALTEVLNVFPIIAKRIGMEEKTVVLLMALVFGKVCGSLFHWTIFVD